MKKLIVIAAVFGAFGAQAQKIKVVNAYTYLNKGKLDLALENIEAAILNEETAKDAKTWKYRADVISAIASSKEIEFRSLVKADEVVPKLKESYQKVFELDEKDKYTSDIKKQISFMEATSLNQGVAAFNEQKYKEAFAGFIGASVMGEMIGITDSLAIFNAAVAAEKAGLNDEAIKYYQQSIDIKYGDSKTYLFIINLVKKKNNPTELINIIKKARKDFPSDQAFVIEELNFYLLDSKFEEAAAALKVAVDNDPNNPELYYTAGSVYERTKKYAEAEKAYSKALELKPNYSGAAFSLGAMYFNEGVEYNNEANALDYNKQKDKITAANKKAEASFKKALPLLEKVLESKPDDREVLSSLKQLYLRLEMNDKYKEVKAKLGDQ